MSTIYDICHNLTLPDCMYDNDIIFSGTSFKDRLIRLYGRATFFTSPYVDDGTVTASEDFTDSYNAFISDNAFNFSRIKNALEIIYNPTHNYDRYEEVTDESESTKEENLGATNTTTTYGDGHTTTTDNIFVEDSDTATPEKSGSVSSTKGNDMISTNAVTNGESVTSSDTHTGHIYGNIGVVDNVALITNELRLRKTSLLDYVVTMFFDKYGY